MITIKDTNLYMGSKVNKYNECLILCIQGWKRQRGPWKAVNPTFDLFNETIYTIRYVVRCNNWQ